jgi:hypothetical protein
MRLLRSGGPRPRQARINDRGHLVGAADGLDLQRAGFEALTPAGQNAADRLGVTVTARDAALAAFEPG